MSEIPKAYEPQAVEEKWYAHWLREGCFTADAASPKPAYSIVIPPPNVTGMLTLGHVLNNSIQDILARRARMTGHEVLWLPGTDHAGIATQTMVEKRLRKEEGKTRHDLGREEFLRRVWEWKEKHGGIIIQQLKKLGCSCDWTRERFTMDPDYSREVQRVFVDLYKKGLIYRGKRMVNWDPAALTALSDEEVNMKPTNGTLYYFKVEVAPSNVASDVAQPSRLRSEAERNRDGCATLTIATTRPETIFGDTAIAVNPHDERYAHLIGKKAVRPLPADIPFERKLIPIVADEHIDPKFGTGVLKVTPAHDKADFEIGQRHGLETLDVMNPDGTLNDLAGAEFAGMERFAARQLAAEKLREMGLLVKEEPYQNNVGYSERTDVPIEPRLSEQWFLRYPQVERSREAVKNGDIHFRPERWANVFEHWMANIQDWCISRQLWWGHRVPVWYKVAQPSRLRSASDRNRDGCATFFDAFAEVDVSRRNLPHWRQPGTTYFVTFRLADSLPAAKLTELEAERAAWLTHNPEPWTETQRAEYVRRFSAKIDDWLDAGSGSCVLREERAAKIVADALQHFDGERYELGAWVVMPNHVHALVAPRESHELSDILHAWKSFTAHEINKVLGREGRLWQHESYDHIVRNEKALWTIEDYIDRNPEKAGITVTQSSRPKVAQPSRLRSEAERNRDGCATFVGLEPPQSEGDGEEGEWQQDPDVLDTWFSSWLWPFATMDEATRAKFYPTNDLVTGPDIIFFWVARMIMAGLEYTGQKPFSDVFFTGLIRDSQGRKMSKTLGNSPDPLDLIAKYGADGLRFGLMRISPQGQDIRFDEKQIEEGRNFANKLWNAARFRQLHGPSVADASLAGLRLSIYSLDILAKLDELLVKVEAAYASYRFNDIAGALYEFFWSEYCDWFVEAAKTEIFSDDATAKHSALSVMDYVLSRVLRLLHPFMPHITEELWQRLGFTAAVNHAPERGNLIMFAQFPTASHLAGIDHETLAGARTHVAAVYHSVRAARNLRAEYRIPSSRKVRFILKSQPDWVVRELATFARLANAEEVALEPLYHPSAGVPRVLTALGEIYMPLAGLVDVAAERERLGKEIAKAETELVNVRRKLSNESFISNAPPAVVDEHRKRESDWLGKLAQLQKMQAALASSE